MSDVIPPLMKVICSKILTMMKTCCFWPFIQFVLYSVHVLNSVCYHSPSSFSVIVIVCILGARIQKIIFQFLWKSESAVSGLSFWFFFSFKFFLFNIPFRPSFTFLWTDDTTELVWLHFWALVQGVLKWLGTRCKLGLDLSHYFDNPF